MKKNVIPIILCLACSILPVACHKPIPMQVISRAPVADLVIRNARIFTVNPSQPEATAVAAKGEWIVAVGSDKEIAAWIKPGHTRVIDGRGSLVTPGFNDAHLHFWTGGRSLLELDLKNISDRQVIQKMVRDQVSKSGPGELIRGRGWNHELFPDQKWPSRQDLDLVAPDNPVFLVRTDGHSVWVNSYLLRESGITRDTPNPPGGWIVKDPQTGEPTGILKESAENLLKMKGYEDLPPDDRLRFDRQVFELALAAARENGLTSVQHLNDNHQALKKFLDEGKLTARITFQMQLTDDRQKLAEFQRLKDEFPLSGNWLRFGYLKGFIDGSMGSGTALMGAPYSDDPATSGLAQMPYETLEKQVVLADRLGFQIGIHAIGDLGNHWILNAYEKAQQVNGKRDSRHRSEHAQVLFAKDIPRFAQLGVIASMQPSHCISDKIFAEKRIGRDRCRTAYAWRSLLQANAAIAFGTDWAVESLNPMDNLYAAVTRKDRNGEPGDGWFPEQKLTMPEAIRLYTLGSAYAEFTEDRKGMIKPGMLADLVILTQNLLQIPPEQIQQTKINYTIVGGRIVFERSH